MMFSVWHLWVVVAILLFLVEIFAPNFVMASFGIGCLFSALAAGLGFFLKMQIVGFIVGTLIAFFAVRPVFTKYCYKASKEVLTNVDALIGLQGRVSETIEDSLHSGRVFVRGDDWKAVSIDRSTIRKDAQVEIVRIEGTTLYVRQI
jgi:inner membrane protein